MMIPQSLKEFQTTSNNVSLLSRPLRELHLFAGAGGGILGGMLCGHTTVCAVEIEPYCRKVLLQRQRDGILPKFPIWDDVCTFDGTAWRGKVDIVCGGFPCQDISSSGKGAGIEGSRSSMWKHMARIIGEIRPQYAFVENSPMLVGRGLTTVLADLANLGYDARWGIVGAHHVAAPHKRDRIWIYATNSTEPGLEGQWGPGESSKQRKGYIVSEILRERAWGNPETSFLRMDDGMGNRVGRIKSCGNGQVPAVAELAWEILSK